MWNIGETVQTQHKVALLQHISHLTNIMINFQHVECGEIVKTEQQNCTVTTYFPLPEMTYLGIRNVGEIVKTQHEVAVITYSPLPEMTYFQCGFFVLVRI